MSTRCYRRPILLCGLAAWAVMSWPGVVRAEEPVITVVRPDRYLPVAPGSTRFQIALRLPQSVSLTGDQLTATVRCQGYAPWRGVVELDTGPGDTELRNGASEATPIPAQPTGTVRTIGSDGGGSSGWLRMTTPIPLNPGSCEVNLEGRLSNGATAPATVMLSVAASPASEGVVSLLSIGVGGTAEGAIRGNEPLEYPRPDAEAVRDAFVRARRDGVWRTVNEKVLVNGNASRSEIIKGLRWLVDMSAQSQLTVLFLAGHGARDGSSDQYYFVPADFRGDRETTRLTGKDLRFFLKQMKGRVLMILDTCAASAVIRGPREAQADPVVVQDISRLNDEQSTVLPPESGFAILAASRVYAREDKIFGEHGLFTYVLLEGIRHGAGRTLGELDGYVSHCVKQLSGGQQEPMSDVRRMGGQPIISPTGRQSAECPDPWNEARRRFRLGMGIAGAVLVAAGAGLAGWAAHLRVIRSGYEEIVDGVRYQYGHPETPFVAAGGVAMAVGTAFGLTGIMLPRSPAEHRSASVAERGAVGFAPLPVPHGAGAGISFDF